MSYFLPRSTWSAEEYFAMRKKSCLPSETIIESFQGRSRQRDDMHRTIAFGTHSFHHEETIRAQYQVPPTSYQNATNTVHFSTPAPHPLGPQEQFDEPQPEFEENHSYDYEYNTAGIPSDGEDAEPQPQPVRPEPMTAGELEPEALRTPVAAAAAVEPSGDIEPKAVAAKKKKAGKKKKAAAKGTKTPGLRKKKVGVAK
ncbi:hypothetical protein J8273_8529 [Carpediemonas membranifera]|uniref:Uncharacterized protein n=1 Tax=Carpediemonas membranifera TaxID=201153 RepID=A0A8J6ARV7_9EUKA|nr:hypothetical protein J8273_8529 [Carpediemonas membranifera]|eukprot:KAG9389850.1 hypothetical protein J8273_8529 [Carpediemonas membranifera]